MLCVNMEALYKIFISYTHEVKSYVMQDDDSPCDDVITDLRLHPRDVAPTP